MIDADLCFSALDSIGAREYQLAGHLLGEREASWVLFVLDNSPFVHGQFLLREFFGDPLFAHVCCERMQHLGIELCLVLCCHIFC